MRKVVGISQKIRRVWLDAMLDRLVQTTDAADLRAFLDKHLKEDLPGAESRAKTSGIVLRIWSGIPHERVSLRDRAVAMLPRISGHERIWLHWGMTALAYPFFRDTAEIVGRLLALQDDFTTGQVQGRMLTSWGDRATSREAAQKLVTTLVDWEVLRSRKTKGHFLLARRITASLPELQLWLLEALLSANNAEEIEAQQLLRLPESFPFTLNVGVDDLRRHEGFNIHRQGLDMDMVTLRNVKLGPPPKPTRKARKQKTAKAEGVSLFNMQAEEFVVPNNGPNAVPVPPPMPQTADDHHGRVDELQSIEESIKSEVLRTLSDRASRFLQVRRDVLAVSDGPFAARMVECAEQFRDGHFFGCIALAQAVLEALIRHIWQIKLKKPHQQGSFEKNLHALYKKKLISDEWKVRLDKVWADRELFHPMPPLVECDQQKLEEKARSTLTLLQDLEREFFGFYLARRDHGL